MSNNPFTACMNGDIEALNAALENGTSPNAINETGYTLLMLAVEHGRKDVADFLIRNGADVNYQMNGGWSALHQAVDSQIDGVLQGNGDIEETPTDLIEFLIANGADTNISVGGETPADIAQSYGCSKIEKLLRGVRCIKANIGF